MPQTEITIAADLGHYLTDYFMKKKIDKKNNQNSMHSMLQFAESC